MVNRASVVFVICLVSVILLGIHYISDYFNYKIIILDFSPALTVSFDNLLRSMIVFIIIIIGWILTNVLLILALYTSSKRDSGW